MANPLYHIKNVFLLRVGTNIYTIDEPIKWDTIAIGLEFDEAAKTYKFEFTDKDVLLEFDNAAGRMKLIEEYVKNGVQGDASLKFGEQDINGVITILYEASLNFDSWSKGESVVKMNAEKRSFGETVKNFMDTKIDLFSTLDLSGGVLDPLTKDDLFLHPRQLTNIADYKFNNIVFLGDYDLYFGGATYAQGDKVRTLSSKIYTSKFNGNAGHPPDTSPTWWTITNEFAAPFDQYSYDGTPNAGEPDIFVVVPPLKAETNNIFNGQDPTPPDGTLIYSGLTFSQGIDERKFKFSGKLHFNFHQTRTTQVGFSIFKVSDISDGIPHGGSWYWVRTASVLYQNVSASFFTNDIETDIEFETDQISGLISLKQDEAIFILVWAKPQLGGTVSNFKWTHSEDCYLGISEQTVYKPSTAKAVRIHDAINRQFEIVTGKRNVLKSNFFGYTDLGYSVDGCASNHYLLNGLMVRGVPGKAFLNSIRDYFNGVNNLFCMGMSVERDNLGVESVRLEPLPYFFRNVELYEFASISKYNQTPASKYQFNEMEFSFQKFPQDNQPDSLDDPFTKFAYITPLDKIKNKLQVVVNFILSPYYIEYTRQQSFEANPKTTYETDNDTFLISANSKNSALATGAQVVWDLLGQKVTVKKFIPVLIGDVLVFSGLPINNGLFTVINIDIPFAFDSVVLTFAEGYVEGTFTHDISLAVPRASAKRDEQFDSITGIPNPKSIYNLEHHIKRIMLRWAKVFQSGWAMYAATGARKIKPVSGINNTSLSTRLKKTQGCRYDDYLYSGESRQRDDFFFEYTQELDRPLFGCNYIYFESKLDWSILSYLRTAFEGRNPDGKDYGYITITNPDGVKERGYLISLKMNPVKQTCKITLIEKYHAV